MHYLPAENYYALFRSRGKLVWPWPASSSASHTP